VDLGKIASSRSFLSRPALQLLEHFLPFLCFVEVMKDDRSESIQVGWRIRILGGQKGQQLPFISHKSQWIEAPEPDLLSGTGRRGLYRVYRRA
jgi:hypothetical protein